jgi:hypothetical protein
METLLLLLLLLRKMRLRRLRMESGREQRNRWRG